jgi:predicted DNA-binding transcriptional regulator AlpA
MSGVDEWKFEDEANYKRPGPFLSWKAVQHIVVFAHSHIYVLEQAGLFPMHLRYGNGRVVWRQSDIIAWMQARLDERPSGASGTQIKPGDRFIVRREMKELVTYTVDYLADLERAGKFPGRVRLGYKRIAWLEREVAQWLWQRRPSTVAATPRTQAMAARLQSTYAKRAAQSGGDLRVGRERRGGGGGEIEAPGSQLPRLKTS